MGEIADYYIQQQMQDPDYILNNSVVSSSFVWLTAKGEEIKVAKMTNTHVQNTLRCLHEGRIPFSNSNEETLWIKIFENECNNRNIEILPIRPESQCDATESDIY